MARMSVSKTDDRGSSPRGPAIMSQNFFQAPQLHWRFYSLK